MIKLYNTPVELGNFPDGTSLFRIPENNRPPWSDAMPPEIEWHYENERELFVVYCLAKQLRENGCGELSLKMPYIPNARQDRKKEDCDVFTLKWFAELINSLNFWRVTVLDPHSNVSTALFNNLRVLTPETYVNYTLGHICEKEGEEPVMFYPDEGASKRYSDLVNLPYAFGIKKRNWQDGKILGLDVAGATEYIAGKNILIVDDICSKGGTFYFAAKKLKEMGAKNIYLYISHCENTILDGDLINSGLIEHIYTTDSILTASHPLITVYEV